MEQENSTRLNNGGNLESKKYMIKGKLILFIPIKILISGCFG
jgi:hypothetical protein